MKEKGQIVSASEKCNFFILKEDKSESVLTFQGKGRVLPLDPSFKQALTYKTHTRSHEGLIWFIISWS